jgi:hypothetical protein
MWIYTPTPSHAFMAQRLISLAPRRILLSAAVVKSTGNIRSLLLYIPHIIKQLKINYTWSSTYDRLPF